MEDVSFSYRAKEEIISKINSKPKADVCMMGMLTYCNCLSDDEISFLTENKAVADFFVLNTGRITGNENAVLVTEQKKRNGVVLYALDIPEREDRLTLLDYFRMDKSRRLEEADLPKEKFYPQLVAGIFLACGSVNNPEKKYHMEFVMPTLELCNDFGMLLIDNYDITPKHVERKNAGIEAVFPLWHIGRENNVRELLSLGYKCLIKSINNTLLPKSILGKTMDDEVISVMEQAKIDICGENGEYHTLVLNGPVFKQPVNLKAGEILDFGDYSVIDVTL